MRHIILPLLTLAACAPVPYVAPAEMDASRSMLEAPTCDGDRIDTKTEDALLQFLTTQPLETVYDAQFLIEASASTFEACGDARGLFATVYRPITEGAIEAIEEGQFQDEAWGRRLLVDFAQRYLVALVDELQGEKPSWAWDRYYELAANPDVSRTRVAATGMMAHLILDLPYCLSAIGTEESHRDDYFAFGDILVRDADRVVTDLWERHGVDAADLLGGFFWGDWIDATFDEQTTTAFSFQTIRLKAWNNRWFLDQSWGGWIAEGEIVASFWTLDGIRGTLDAAGII